MKNLILQILLRVKDRFLEKLGLLQNGKILDGVRLQQKKNSSQKTR
jgi:hypothetical protein